MYCSVFLALMALITEVPNVPQLGAPQLSLSGVPASAPSSAVCGFSLIADERGPQAAALGADAFAVCLRDGENVVIEIPVANLAADSRLEAEVTLMEGAPGRVSIAFDGEAPSEIAVDQAGILVETHTTSAIPQGVLRFTSQGGPGESVIRWRAIRLAQGSGSTPISALPSAPLEEVLPSPTLPALRPGMEQVLIEWDWRMRDGIGVEREPVSYAVAIERTLQQGQALLDDLKANGASLDAMQPRWQAMKEEYQDLADTPPPGSDPRWEDLWRRVHRVRREIVLSNPLSQTGPILFAKHSSSFFSHQLTQYYGRLARPGGGLFVLERPGASMACRALAAGQLPVGSYMQPELSYDATRILFAYCEVPSVPDWNHFEQYRDRKFHLYEMQSDGSGLRRMTEGPYDDFSPRELPDGRIIFISTRRGGFHRCGRGPCDVYTLALAEADGANPHPISYHETNEWDPAVLEDGRVIYTRWDYVDRNAVHYQHLWSVRPDGSNPVAFFGNNTFNPVGIWEARSVPGSPLVMATAAAHHAMTAGSIILLDRQKGVDGLGPITRLTPDAPFPESETQVVPTNWHAPGSPAEYPLPEEQQRWPGHCYRSAYPLSEDYFLVAYSFDPLIGEPGSNKANMFGLYFADAFGNRELLYRDLNISSLWPIPLRARPKPPAAPTPRDERLANEGTFYIQDANVSSYGPLGEPVKSLRIVQVLPKTTPNANTPTVGLANASPGKQVLGTVPVEADGSAYFVAPAGTPLAFQALDERGRALQVMRSVTYLQPGEQASCVGCHEDRLSAPPPARFPLAVKRAPSRIIPAPDGANPLSYPLLVQPVLDKHCVQCHGREEPAGPEGKPLVLTGEPEGRYTKSYNVLAQRVPFSSWGGLPENGEPATEPGRFGARASQMMNMLLEGHHDVQLNEEEIARLVTWMDANALFYGTFDPKDQERQLRGERIEGAALY